MNVTEQGLRSYVEAFHQTLRTVSEQFFEPAQANLLLHRSLLPAKIICYVSTQFGVAIEYLPATETTIETVRGSARVEDLITNPPEKLRKYGKPVAVISSSQLRIENLHFQDGLPFRLANGRANVTLLNMDFSCSSLNWTHSITYAEVYGDRRSTTWSVSEAQHRAKDEVLTALALAQLAQNRCSQVIGSMP